MTTTRHMTPEARWDEAHQYWRVNVQQDGVRKTFYEKTEGRRGKRICEAKAQDWLDSNTPGDLRFDVACERYLESKKRTVKASTYSFYTQRTRSFLIKPLGSKKLSRITEQNLQDILDKMAADGYSKHSIDNVRNHFHDFANWCRRSKLEFCPVDDLRTPENAWVGERDSLQPEHLAVLFNEDNKINRKAWYIHGFRLLAILGLRRGEMCGLRWDDINNGVLTVSRSIGPTGVISTPKTKNAIRKIYLPDIAVKILEDQKAMLAKYHCISPYVFPAKRDLGEFCKPPALLECWKKYCAKQGLPDFCLHELRHTAISMYKADVPEELLKSVVGHSVHMDTYKVYGHEFGSDAKRAAAAMDNVVENILGRKAN